MKFHAERSTFVDAVVWAARTVPARPSMPALSGLRLEVTNDPEPTLTIASFDNDVSGEVTIPVTVEEPGVALVNGRLLADIAKSLPGKPVSVAVVGPRLTVSSGRSAFELPTLPLADYPALPDMPHIDGIVNGAAFAGAVTRVAIATRREDPVPTLTAVRIEVNGEEMTLAGTDRYRLAIKTLPWNPRDSAFEGEAMIPSRTLLDTAKSLAATDEVNIAFGIPGMSDGLVGIEGSGRRTTSRQISGAFPNYRALLPQSTPIAARVETAPLIEAVRRVALVAESSAAVKLTFTDTEVRLDAGSGSDSTGSDALECTVKGGPVDTISFNSDYLVDGLSSIGGAVTDFAITDPLKPVILKGAASFDAPVAEDYLYLLMPIRQPTV